MGEQVKRKGPLAGVRIVEMAGIGPGPMAAMLLADLGATIIRVDRREKVELGIKRPARFNLLNRNREILEVDLKDPAEKALVLTLVERADALIEGFRPGTMERLGLGPDDCLARNQRLVYGRITGWGQDGPRALTAGHDINYISITGALDAIGPQAGPPIAPLNLVGDYAGGALYLAMGILAAVIEARTSGKGQVVDAAICDGVASLMTNFHGMNAAGIHLTQRGENILDGGAPYYGVYMCADGGYMAVGPIESRFEADMLRILGIDPATMPPRDDRAQWPRGKAIVAAAFLTQDRAYWERAFDGTDACASPVLTLVEAVEEPHLAARHTYVEIDGVIQPAPAPRFSRTPPAAPHGPVTPDNLRALAAWLDPAEIAGLSLASS
ncbi:MULTISPECIES: CaiB/BaiF CoA transferase family protein [unclassified Sphingobium]|uniref:CaiB/BaiF CoA transferase family protein n=1 Tax=unclassified Sphingobium TaxID=2611147 RepID=UPI000D1759B0|nr:MULTISPECIES: CaiB/BaiF CoA-transferase family protein [unclassified Sphingobium]MBG6120047.1 crotonobetainyl-CoA:carnitine CoA-transferase CaiB-like acyl-CoA transferase [Sphingobium sp. JAI105]PSO12898.1 carnitine dehydratase [Sphingobium sp. AEW4]TWD05752.1 crotonobetainyl-CoA:carnitine CoA-transferase CaiB-like acyl-CoA transferase [Sphingobium sp. AEW010]TWD23305.1 crotonobetainyl-CoA:carnitine CoA-transferase CaiB-like acyl-CoA transferase [Sphingobium sp. AEW013]TWD25165.1 crotonobet